MKGNTVERYPAYHAKNTIICTVYITDNAHPGRVTESGSLRVEEAETSCWLQLYTEWTDMREVTIISSNSWQGRKYDFFYVPIWWITFFNKCDNNNNNNNRTMIELLTVYWGTKSNLCVWHWTTTCSPLCCWQLKGMSVSFCGELLHFSIFLVCLSEYNIGLKVHILI